MKTKTVIITMLLLFSLTGFAQEKQLPNKEETKNYLDKMLSTADRKEYVSRDGDTYKVPYLYSYSYNVGDNINYNSFSYDYGTTVLDCTWMGRYTEEVAKRRRTYSNFDFRKLNNVSLKSSSASKATALEVILLFEDKNINSYIEYYGYTSLACKVPERQTDKVDFVVTYIPNEEGSFDRFKKALLHYKDLLIAEQKQKLANDPFAN